MEKVLVYICPAIGLLLVFLAVRISRRNAGDKKRLANLALFPQQNPNPVIEVSMNGEVTYMNPAAKNQFPELQISGFEHELFSLISEKVEEFKSGELKMYSCEINIEGRIFEQKVYAITESNLLRVYSSDITKQKEIENRLANLALFPQQNPNPVIELRLDGKVSYLNPAAQNRFPDMEEKGSEHPLFDIIRPKFDAFHNGTLSSYTCEITIGEEVYEQKVYAIPQSKILRVYSSDITERKRTEKIIRQKNEDITDSINYAKRIQRSMLPKEEEMDAILEDYFVLYMPKDIVSGDFYWVNRVKLTPREQNAAATGGNKDVVVIAAIDCTGHGVPGALMSIIGNTLLNQTIKNPLINSPAEALDYLNHELPKNLRAAKGEVIRDGMDMTMCAINFATNTLQMAGANNPIYIISGETLNIIKGNKQPVSGSTEEEKKPFTNNSVQLQKGDIVYLFTDGYADQFGGPNGKKFKYKQFQEILSANAKQRMHKQNSAKNF
jgi:serine phosphatase RsbU (regulator of sigma subunit)